MIFIVLLFFISIPVYAADEPEQLIVVQEAVVQEQSKQHNPVQTEKERYSFLAKPAFTNTGSQSTAKQLSANDSGLSVTLALIFILVVIFSLAWFMKKMGYSHIAGQGQLKIIASLNLGQKEKIALIQVGKQQLLVGMTATQINTLHVLDEVLEETQSNQFTAAGSGAFASKFSQLLKNKQNKLQ